MRASFAAAVLALALSGGGAAAQVEKGRASVYHDKYEGRPTASGAPFRQHALTAAHRTLPFGTRVTARNLATGREVRVVINDRGPFVDGRVIDLSRAAARALGVTGTAPVAIRVD